MCRSGNLTHLLHSPMHPIGITRRKMGQDLGTVNAFPEKGVMLEGRERKMWCTRDKHFRASSGFKLGLHFLSREVQDAPMDQFEERTRTGNATRAGAGFAVCWTCTQVTASCLEAEGIPRPGARLGSLTMSFLSPKAWQDNITTRTWWLLEAELVLAELKDCGTNRSSPAEDSSTHTSIPWEEGKHSSPGRSSPGSS